MDSTKSITFAGIGLNGAATVVMLTFPEDALPLKQEFNERLREALHTAYPEYQIETALDEKVSLSLCIKPTLTEVDEYHALCRLVEEVASALGIAVEYVDVINAGGLLETIMQWLRQPYPAHLKPPA